MFLPQFEVYHKNLHTSYLNLSNFINFLKNDLFTGYIQIKTSEKECLIFLDHGQVINTFEILNNEYKFLSLEGILSNINEGIVNVYRLPEETAPFWANLVTAEILYPNLSTDFTDLIRLLHKLKREEITGWAEIILSGNEKSFIYFQNGIVIGTCSSWKNWLFEKGEAHLPEITKRTSEAVFNVYKLPLEQISTNINLENITNFFQEYLAVLEKIIGEKNFSLLWRQKGVEKAEKYPFLDPFANEFEYKEGKIAFYGDASEKELLEALKEVCTEIIKHNKNLEKKIVQEASYLKQKYKIFIENTGLSSLLGI